LDDKVASLTSQLCAAGDELTASRIRVAELESLHMEFDNEQSVRITFLLIIYVKLKI
jgi:hypothetical protein